MHPNQEKIEQLYRAFNLNDADTMAACYHPQAVFSDPVFRHLQGSEIGMMWKMLCLQSSTLEVQAGGVMADDERGQADWTAIYEFGKARRKVHNKIHAEFKFKDGQIIEHIDQFDFWKWSRMALGSLGLFMGWNPVVQANIQKQAQVNLTKFITKVKNM